MYAGRARGASSCRTERKRDTRLRLRLQKSRTPALSHNPPVVGSHWCARGCCSFPTLRPRLLWQARNVMALARPSGVWSGDQKRGRSRWCCGASADDCRTGASYGAPLAWKRSYGTADAFRPAAPRRRARATNSSRFWKRSAVVPVRPAARGSGWRARHARRWPAAGRRQEPQPSWTCVGDPTMDLARNAPGRSADLRTVPGRYFTAGDPDARARPATGVPGRMEAHGENECQVKCW